MRVAEAALRQGRFAAAEDRLARAATAVLNARRDGETGFSRSVNDVIRAREAVARHDREGAHQAIADAVRDIANRA